MQMTTRNLREGARSKLIALLIIAVMAVGALANCPGFALGGILEADEFHSYSIEIEAGSWGIQIDGTGEGDLDLYVYDENGLLLAADLKAGNSPFVLFEVEHDMPVYIFVHNAGTGRSEYIGLLD
jgi:hypothetical protein